MLSNTTREKNHEREKKPGKHSFDLWELISKLSTEHAFEADKRGLFFDVVVSDEVPRFFIGDFTKVKEIFSKLVNFSMESIKTGGITIRVKTSCLLDSNRQHLEIDITDTGLGFLSEKLQMALQSKYLLNSKLNSIDMMSNTLYTMKILAKKMGGDLYVYSTYGRGTRYTASFQCQAVPDENRVWKWDA